MGDEPSIEPGSPHAGTVIVRIADPEESGRRVARIVVESDGRFAVRLPPGGYVVEGIIDRTPEVTGDPNTHRESVEALVAAGRDTRVEILVVPELAG